MIGGRRKSDYKLFDDRQNDTNKMRRKVLWSFERRRHRNEYKKERKEEKRRRKKTIDIQFYDGGRKNYINLIMRGVTRSNRLEFSSFSVLTVSYIIIMIINFTHLMTL